MGSVVLISVELNGQTLTGAAYREVQGVHTLALYLAGGWYISSYVGGV